MNELSCDKLPNRLTRKFFGVYKDNEYELELLFKPNSFEYDENDYEIFKITGIDDIDDFKNSLEFKNWLVALEQPVTDKDFDDTVVWLYETFMDCIDCRVFLICVNIQFSVKDKELNPFSCKYVDVTVMEQDYMGQHPCSYGWIKTDPIVTQIYNRINDGYYDYELKYKALGLTV